MGFAALRSVGPSLGVAAPIGAAGIGGWRRRERFVLIGTMSFWRGERGCGFITTGFRAPGGWWDGSIEPGLEIFFGQGRKSSHLTGGMKKGTLFNLLWKVELNNDVLILTSRAMIVLTWLFW